MFPSMGLIRALSPVLYTRSMHPSTSIITKERAVSSGLVYPRATPSPPRTSSPITPMGTSRRLPSTMKARLFEIDLPIGTERGRSFLLRGTS